MKVPVGCTVLSQVKFSSSADDTGNSNGNAIPLSYSIVVVLHIIIIISCKRHIWEFCGNQAIEFMHIDYMFMAGVLNEN